MVKKNNKKNKSKKTFPKQAKGNKNNIKIGNEENDELKNKANNKNIILNFLKNKNKKSNKIAENSKYINKKKAKTKNKDNNFELNWYPENSSSYTNKDNFSISSLELNDSKVDFSFIKDNEKKWINYFDLSEIKDINRWSRLFQYAAEILTKDDKEVDILINLILKIDEIRKNSKYGEIKEKFTLYEIPIYDIWNINDFYNYFDECWNKYKFSSTYKTRYTEKYKKLLFKSWENILCFMGFHFIMDGENIWNYIWYLWILPKKLLILWYSRINLCEKNDFWWIVLLKEWFNYFMEILRVGSIKKWINDFIGVKENDNVKKKTIKYLHMKSGVLQNNGECENNNEDLKE